MPLTRTILDWSRPVPEALARFLVGSSIEASKRGDGPLDLSGWLVVLPVARAGRRTLAHLARERERLRLGVLPPRFGTPGDLASHVLDLGEPQADLAARTLAWAHALATLTREERAALVRRTPETRATRWSLARLVARAHDRLLAHAVTFAEVLERGVLDDVERWAALAKAEREYRAVIGRAGVADPGLAAIDPCVPMRRDARGIILAGVASLQPAPRRLIERFAGAPAGEVEIVTFADAGVADRFDSMGLLRPSEPVSLGIEREQVVVVADEGEQADAVLRWIASLPSPRRAADLSIGLGNERSAGAIARASHEAGIDARSAIGGRAIEASSLVRAAGAFAERRDAASLLDLARQPAAWSDEEGGSILGVDVVALGDLDESLARAPAGEGEGLPEGEDALARGRVGRLHDAAIRWLGAIARREPRPLSQWSTLVREFLERAFAGRALRRDRDADRAIEAAHARTASLAGSWSLLRAIDEDVEAGEALAIIADEIGETRAAPGERPGSIELLGWLDLVFDDAPHACLTGFVEGSIPSREPSDPIVADRVRRALGIVEDRFARDAYYVALLLASRPRATLIAPRAGPEGERHAPSSLLTRADRANLAAWALAWAPERPTPCLARARARRPAGVARSRFAEPVVGVASSEPERLGVTWFRTFLASPYLFYLRHVLRVAEIEPEARELSPAEFGILIHAAARRLGDPDAPAGGEDDLRAFLDHALDDAARARAGREPAACVRVQVAMARERLRALAAWQARRAREGWSIVRVEWSDDERAGVLEVDERPVRLMGRIDRVDVHPRLGVELLDLKTGQASAAPGEAHRARDGSWTDLQLPLYRVLAGPLIDDLTPGSRATRDAREPSGDCGLGYIVVGSEGDVSTARADWTPDDLADAERAARQVVRRIRASDFFHRGRIPSDRARVGVPARGAAAIRALADLLPDRQPLDGIEGAAPGEAEPER